MIFMISLLRKKPDKFEAKGYKKVPSQDPDLKYCLDLAGLRSVDGLYEGIDAERSVSSAGMVDGEPAVLAVFAPNDTDNSRVRRYVFASSLGYLVHGKRFGFDSIAYRQARELSDTTLAVYAKFSDDEYWDPRSYVVEKLEKRHRAPIAVLSKVLDSIDSKDRETVVSRIWWIGFGHDGLDRCLDDVSNFYIGNVHNWLSTAKRDDIWE